MNIKHPENFHKLNIEKVEKYYAVKFVGEFPILIPGTDDFAPQPAAIFWRPEENRNVNFTEYMAITGTRTTSGGTLLYYVTDGTYITEYIFNGLKHGDDIVYSRFEEDCQTHTNGAFIEGGFTKRNWDAGEDKAAELVRLQVQGDKIVVLEKK